MGECDTRGQVGVKGVVGIGEGRQADDIRDRGFTPFGFLGGDRNVRGRQLPR